ncbi:MAG TPA: PD-(D/E)XK nuclease family protein [Oligoflexia bacterium]|nr:PD-(D/E)XK nuclease family protein [Oligoflexia bacterium]
MSVKRIFLGWDEPALTSAARWLLEHYPCANGRCDMRAATVILPSSRAERRLLELLVEGTQNQGAVLLPPCRRTVGKLPELLYTAAKPLAEPLQRQAAWLTALAQVSPEKLRELSLRSEQQTALLERTLLAQHLDQLWKELNTRGLSFCNVAEEGAKHFDYFRKERWLILADIHQLFLNCLESWGLIDQFQARIDAVARGECRFAGELCLLACADIPPLICEMINQSGAVAFALVHAPAERADWFDEFGCVLSKPWAAAQIALTEEQLFFCNSPAELAQDAVQILRRTTGRFSAEQIVIGYTADELVPSLTQELEGCGVKPRLAKGTCLTETRPGKLLASAAEYLSDRSFSGFASFVRHPDIAEVLEKHEVEGEQHDFLTALDVFYTETLPASAEPAQLSQTHALSGTAHAVAGQAHSLLQDLLGKPRPLHEWAQPILEFLRRTYTDTICIRDDPGQRITLAACEKIAAALSTLHELNAAIDEPLHAAEALRFVLNHLFDEEIPPEPVHPAIELLGWLELLLDDAPLLIVAGLNEEYVPLSITADPFLPNTLRQKLGLLDNERRLARDAYAFTAMLHSKQHLYVLAARRDNAGNALLPSRLAMAVKGELLAERTLRFHRVQEEQRFAFIGQRTGTNGSFGITPLPAHLTEPISSMSVSSFRDYLVCPYRFYLKHVLHLQTIDDRERELNAAHFGTLAHRVLAVFGRSQQTAALFSKDEIADLLDTLLLHEQRRVFGSTALPSTAIQIEQLRGRLRHFAGWQAGWAAQGWQIKWCERTIKDSTAALDLGRGRLMRIRGTIDRVDYNPQENTWAIFDYKTSDTAKTPGTAHRKKDGTWLDLQLPLYDYLLEPAIGGASVKLGYINLGKSEKSIGASWLDFSDETLLEALGKAREVAENVYEQVFWPPSPESPPGDEFADICGVGLLCEEEDSEQ